MSRIVIVGGWVAASRRAADHGENCRKTARRAHGLANVLSQVGFVSVFCRCLRLSFGAILNP